MEFSRIGAVPDRPYASAVIADGRFIFVSGQTPTRNGLSVDGSIGEQTAVVLENMAAVLALAGVTLNEVVRCGDFLSDLADLKDFNAAAPTTAPTGAARRHPVP
jgi:2-iminobutanoate/2-iminopropanoate deaminase